MKVSASTETVVCADQAANRQSLRDYFQTMTLPKARKMLAAAGRMASLLVHCPYEGAIYADKHLICQCCGSDVWGPQHRDHLVGQRVTVVGNHHATTKDGQAAILRHLQECILVSDNPDNTYTVEGPVWEEGKSPKGEAVLGRAVISPNHTRAARPGMVGAPIQSPPSVCRHCGRAGGGMYCGVCDGTETADEHKAEQFLRLSPAQDGGYLPGTMGGTSR